MKKPFFWSAVTLSGVLFLIDQTLKFFALNTSAKLFGANFGWRPFLNTGIAFGIPVPIWLVIIFTLPVLIYLVWYIQKNIFSPAHASLVLVVVGALSNLFDRVVWQGTVDYFLVYTSIFNVADILIVVGIVGFLWLWRAENSGAVLKK